MPSCAPTSRCSPQRRPDRITTYGDFSDGLHRHPEPARRQRAEPPAAAASRPRPRRGAGRTPQPAGAARRRPTSTTALVTRVLDDAGINYLTVTGRAKTRGVVRCARPARAVDGAPRLRRPVARDHRPDRRARHHLRAQRRRGGGRACSPTSCTCWTTATWGRRPRARAGSATPAGTCWSAGPPTRGRRSVPRSVGRARPGADPHGAAARVGGVRARHPLQGQRPERARARPRPALHPRRRAARAGRRRVLRRSATGCARPTRPPTPAGPRRPTRASTPRTSRRSWPGSTPTPAGRAPTTTPGSRGCCWSWASPRSRSSAGPAQHRRRRRARPPDGLQVPARRRTPSRRRPARRASATRYLALHGNAHRDDAAAGPAGQADRTRWLSCERSEPRNPGHGHLPRFRGSGARAPSHLNQRRGSEPRNPGHGRPPRFRGSTSGGGAAGACSYPLVRHGWVTPGAAVWSGRESWVGCLRACTGRKGTPGCQQEQSSCGSRTPGPGGSACGARASFTCTGPSRATTSSRCGRRPRRSRAGERVAFLGPAALASRPC